MTNDELKAPVAGLSIAQKEATEQIKATDRQIKSLFVAQKATNKQIKVDP